MSINLEDVLQELQAAHLIHAGVDSEPTFLFNHVLMQETAYHVLLLKGRRELHLLVAAAFEQEYADRLEDYVPTLAYHYWLAEDWSSAAEYARQAGERALRVYALREAIRYYAQALEALDRMPLAPGQAICDVILGWSQAAFGFEPYPRLLEQLERAEGIARQLGDKRRLAMTLLTTGKVHVAAGHGGRAEAPLAECFALATELGDDQLAVIPTFGMGMVALDSDPRRSLAFFHRAAELARQYNDIDIEANALSMQALVEGRLGETSACRRSLEQALRTIGQGTSPVTDADVYLGAAWAWLELGEVRQALDCAKQSVGKAISTDNMECACLGFACLGFGHLRVEQMKEAVEAFEEAIRRSKISGAEEAQVLGESGLGMVRFYSGHPEGIQDLENTLTHARTIGREYASALLAQTLGEIYLQGGDLLKAETRLKEALDYYRRHRMRLYLARTLELVANVFEQKGERDKANEARTERAELMGAHAHST
jgi:tetratricopeptide (TPR) repeat protein